MLDVLSLDIMLTSVGNAINLVHWSFAIKKPGYYPKFLSCYKINAQLYF